MHKEFEWVQDVVKTKLSLGIVSIVMHILLYLYLSDERFKTRIQEGVLGKTVKNNERVLN